ncbi:MAG TPA: glycosyltransferase [Steroidobacteraceae bacterium]|nr:glycosyltransferase [Steroidobacteraceae bacterium]
MKPAERRSDHPSRSAPACRSVLMVGTDLAGMGGVRTVVEGYIEGGLFQRIDCAYVATHCYGSNSRKVRAALTGWLRAAARLCTLDAPLVHAHISPGASFWRKSVVCLLARIARRPYILHVHGGKFEEFYARCSPPARRLVRTMLVKAALVIALSEAWRAILERLAPQARIIVLPNAVSLPPMDELSRLADREPTLLFLGDVLEHKGAFDLARAFARVATRFPQLKLVLGGAGAIAAMRRLSAQLGLEGRIECTGWLESARKRAELAGATIFVLPSYIEGMPMALLEAMSFGLPAIATAVGGVPEVITPEVNGLLVAPGDIEALAAAIARLMSDPRLRQRLGAAARQSIATRFSLTEAIERLLGIYRRFGIEPHAVQSPRQIGRTARSGSRKPGVLFIVNSLDTGGAEKQVVSLLNHLDARRFRLHLAYLKRGEKLLPQLKRERLATLRCCDVARRIDSRAVRGLRALITGEDLDVIVCTNPYSSLYGRLALRGSGADAKLVSVFHTTRLRDLKERAQMLLYRPLFNRADLLVYVCESQRAYWRARGIRPLAEEVIHNGIDTDEFTERCTGGELRALRRSLGFADEDYLIGICSAFRPEKAHGDLLEAIALLRSRGLPAKALLIGDGPQRRAIERRIAQLDLAKHALITGLKEDVRPFIGVCDVMSLVSHSVETFSLAALESLSLGKPMVLSDIGGATELITHGEHGFLFAPGDIEALAGHLMMLASASLRARLGAAAARRVRERFTVQRMAARFADSLDRLLERPAQSPGAHPQPVRLNVGGAPER